MTDIVNESAKAQASVLGSVAGTNTVTGGLSPALDAYAAGTRLVFTPANTNTGAVTLNIDSLGALDVQKFNGNALAAGDLIAGIPAMLVLDSGADDWILLNPQVLLQSGGFEVGYRGVPSRDITASDNTAASDNGRIVNCGGAGGYTFTVDSDFGVAGYIMTLLNASGGSVTIAETLAGNLNWLNGAGALVTGSRTLAVGGVATIWMATATAAYLWGSGIT
jgi:hypothetical protein